MRASLGTLHGIMQLTKLIMLTFHWSRVAVEQYTCWYDHSVVTMTLVAIVESIEYTQSKHTRMPSTVDGPNTDTHQSPGRAYVGMWDIGSAARAGRARVRVA
jgi:hypothetical protein